jgi:hypothetical protein
MNNRGHLFFAQNTSVDYLTQAYAAALTIKKFNKYNKTCIVTNETVPLKYLKAFDRVITVPWDDDAKDSDWKIENRWKLIHCTPFDETLVYDTDILLLSSNDHWWNILEKRELVLTTKVLDYKGRVIDKDLVHRKTFIENNLPNVYFGVHYFKKTYRAFEFYKWLEIIVKNWKLFYNEHTLNSMQKFCSMDVSAAIATKILNAEEEFTLASPLQFTHMKAGIQGWAPVPVSWQQAVGVHFNENLQLKLSNNLQTGVFHYTEDNFLTESILKKIEASCE